MIKDKKTNTKTKVTYIEPSDYFPKEIRKKYGLGEFEKTTTQKIKQDGKNPE